MGLLIVAVLLPTTVILFYGQAHAVQHPSNTKKPAARKQAVTVATSWLEILAIEPSRERHVIPTAPLTSILDPRLLCRWRDKSHQLD